MRNDVDIYSRDATPEVSHSDNINSDIGRGSLELRSGVVGNAILNNLKGAFRAGKDNLKQGPLKQAQHPPSAGYNGFNVKQGTDTKDSTQPAPILQGSTTSTIGSVSAGKIPDALQRKINEGDKSTS
jgi:hypothetical protein